MSRLFSIFAIALSLLISGCASGRTEFKVFKITPSPLLVITSTPVSTLVPQKDKVIRIQQKHALTATLESKEYKVQAGDCLWHISGRLFGDPWLYKKIAEINRIENPDLIHPGQVLQFTGIMAQGIQLQPAGKTNTIRPAVTPVSTPTITPEAQAIVFPERVNHAFGPGEKLLFSVEYFGISAGYATLSVDKGPEMHGRPTLHLVATARTHPAFEWFFKVRDCIESFFDARSLFSWRYEKHLREGSYSNDSYIIYDQFQQKIIKDQGKTILVAPPLCQDVLSEFYYYRTLDSKVGAEDSIPVVADDGKTYEVLVKVLRREKVRVPAGEFNCLVIEPYLKFEGVFKHQGKIHIWLTDDKRKVPVLIKSGIIIGTINIVLRDAVVADK